MATITASAQDTQSGRLARLWSDVVDFFTLLSNIGSISQQVEQLNATSDEELAARGTTRPAEVARIFSVR